MELTEKRQVIYLAKGTGLSRQEVVDALGGIDFYRRLHQSRQEHLLWWRDGEKKALSMVKKAHALRDAICAYQTDVLLADSGLSLPELNAFIAKAENAALVYQNAPATPPGQRAWASVVIAAGVARVFLKAGKPLTVGEREGPRGREPSTEFCWAVKHVMESLNVAGDFRAAAERGRKLRDKA